MLRAIAKTPLILLICAILTVFSPNLWAGITLKTIAANPSSVKTQTVPFKSYLPEGVQPENVINIGDFKTGFDFDKSLYYVYRDITLAPKESIVLEVEIEDIWAIPESELNFLKDHLNETMKLLRNTKYYASAKLLGDNLSGKLEKIIVNEFAPAANADEYIALHESNKRALTEVKGTLSSLEDIVIELGGIYPDQVLVGDIPAEDEPAKKERGNLSAEGLGTVKFYVTVSNPSTEKTQSPPLKHYLPAEVRPEYVVDSGGLDIGYDAEKKLHYAYKESIEIEPLSSKEFIIEVKDVWFIPRSEIDSLGSRAKRLVNILKGSASYNAANSLGNSILKDLDEISGAQDTEDLSPDRHIGNYRSNINRLNETRGKINKLEKIVLQAGGLPSFSLLEEGSGASKSAEKIKLAGRSIFRGKIPSSSAVWNLIYMIIGFLALVSFLFFTLQFAQHRQLITDTLTGIYNRKYVIDRLQSELQRGKDLNSRYVFLMIDIDKFKSYNDKYGHLVGDTILRMTAYTLRRSLRAIDILSRFGGDEFFIVLPNRTKEEGRAIGERLRKAVSSRTVKARLGLDVLSVTISVGVAAFPDDGGEIEDLIHKADQALYRAKEKGRNGVFVHGT